MNATAEYQRVCPVCGTAAPPDAAQCAACGTLLLGVDLSLRQDAPVAPAATPTAAAPPAAAPATVPCPHADCGAENPPGSARCLYCDRPLRVEAAVAPAAPTHLYRLPAALAEKFRIVEVLPAGGAEAEIMILAGLASGVKVVAKLYRPGIAPNVEVLERVGRGAFRHVVHLIAHGVSEGIGYEVMEYCPAGSLRQLIAAGAPPRDVLRRIVTELADALEALHALNVIHRDLKPENILVRRRDPLDLVLTDFGIASVNDATQRFTGLARTVKYGAPETLSGVLDAAADWWSLGMILAELVAGRHPFDGLSDAVITHRLVTGQVDLADIEDRDWLLLCRGLLQRDPQRRWAAAETRRWLDGDATLEVAAEVAPTAGGRVVQPYRIADRVCHTPVELAAALAAHWEAGRKDLARGQIAAWAGQELRDHNLARFMQDLLEMRDATDDLRLLRLILHLAPDIPPVWRGESLSASHLLARAAGAEQGDATAAEWLVSVYAQQALRALDPARHAAATALAARWEGARERFEQLWRTNENQLARWRAEQTSRDGVADFDALVFGQPAALALPAPAQIHPPLLLAVADEAYAAHLRTRVRTEAAASLALAPWLEELLAQDDPAAWLVARCLAPHAGHVAADTQQRRASATDAAAAQLATFIPRANQLLAMLRDACELGLFASEFERGAAGHAVQALLALLEEARAAGIADDTPLMRALHRAETVVLRIQEQLDAWEHAARINAVWRNRNLLQGAGGGLLLLFVFLAETLPLRFLFWALALPALVVAWRALGIVKLRGTIRTLAKALPLRVPAASSAPPIAAAS